MRECVGQAAVQAKHSKHLPISVSMPSFVTEIASVGHMEAQRPQPLHEGIDKGTADTVIPSL